MLHFDWLRYYRSISNSHRVANFAGFVNLFISFYSQINTGLKITASHRTMSGQFRNLTDQIFYLPVMLTSHIQQSRRSKRKFPRSSVVCDELK